MKHYRVCAGQFKNLILSALMAMLLALPIFYLRAETAGELREKIEQKNEDIQKLEEEIEKYQLQLDSLGKQKDSLNTSLKQLDITRKKLTADMSVTQKKIDRTNLKIAELSLQITNKQGVIANNMQALALDMRRINEIEQDGFLVTMLSEKNFTDVWNDIDSTSAVSEEIRERTADLKKVKQELESVKTETTAAKNELVALKTKLSDQKRIVDQNTKEKQKLLAQTKSSEANYQKILQEQQAKKRAFEQELRNYESQLKFILDPSKLPGSGVLGWPLDQIYVTQQFGAKTGPHRTYVSGHSGTDFRARTPLPVKAMADGVIKGVGDTDSACPGVSFGKWIFIEYGNGLSSTFGHLSLIKVAEGKKVRRGEIIGYTGGTGRVTGPHLHVSLYASQAVKVETIPSKSCPGKILKQPVAPINAYLDPMYYLPPYSQPGLNGN